MGKQRTGLRAFYYFRQGYAQYLALGVGLVTVLTSTYFLAIEHIPSLKIIAPTFEIYILYCVIIGIPLITFFGWFHFKRAGTYSAETAIGQQNHLYNFKWPPGFTLEVFGPVYATILNSQMKLAKGESLTEKEIESIKLLEKQLIKLIDGGIVGDPPSGAFR